MGVCRSKAMYMIIEPKRQNRVAELENVKKETEPYTFQLELSRFKLRGPFLEDCVLKLTCEGRTLTSESGSFEAEHNTVSWETHWSLSLYCTIPQLLDKNIKLELLYSSDKIYASVQLNAYIVARGPMHYTLSLSSKRPSQFSFNFKFLQVTEVQIRMNAIKCYLDYPPDSEFSLGLQLLHSMEESEKYSAVKARPKWDFKKQKYEDSAPSLHFPATIDDIRAGSLNIRLLTRTQNSNWKLAGESWKSFPRLLKAHEFDTYQNETEYFNGPSDPPIKVLTNPGWLLAALDEDLVRKGKVVGTIKGSLWIYNLPFLTQMITGVITAERVELQTLAVISKNTKGRKLELPREVSDIRLLTAQLDKSIRSEASIEPFGLTESDKEIEEHIGTVKELTRLLEKSSMSSMVSFTYNHNNELIAAQLIMLALGEHLCEYCDIIHYSVRPYYFKCMVRLLHRGELDLGSLSLHKQSRQWLKEKQDVARRYAHMLFKLLAFALPKADFPGSDRRVYHLIKLVMAVAYNRVPGFRELLLQAVQEKMWEDVAEWKRAEMGEEKNQEFLPMFNWQALFYKFIPEVLTSRRLTAVLRDKSWQDELAKRSDVYFNFVKEWTQHVHMQFVSQDIPWHEIPGYSVILKSFILELKNRNILMYPEALIKASGSMLLNSALLNPFLEIVFKKANVYSYKTVIECFNVISYWLNALWMNRRGLPFNFDTHLFLKGMKIALSDEVGCIVAKALWLLYRHYHMFRGQRRSLIIHDMLLKDNFQKFAFHWHPQVRKVFFNILIFRIKSLKEFSFETGQPEPVDSEIEAFVDQNLFPLRSRSWVPYFKLAIDEFKKTYEIYREWLVRISQVHAENKIYGAFDSLPYPEINIQIRIDKAERNLDDYL